MSKLSYLIESELEKAEVVLAAKSITDAIQKMAENAASMEPEDVMPLNDAIREHFGAEAADTFAENVGTKLRELVKNLSDAKNVIANEISRLQGDAVDMPSSDLDVDEFPADDGEDATNDLEMPEEPAAEEPAGDDEGAVDFGDEMPRFNDEDLGHAAGRARKESVETSKKILEGFDPDKALAREYIGLLKEGKSASEASSVITETYGIGIETLITVMESFSKGQR